MKRTIVLFATLIPLLNACVSGAPKLSAEQRTKLSQVTVHKQGNLPSKEFKVISEVSGADCSGAPLGGRVWGSSEKAIEILKAKATVLNADAVINVNCGAIPLLNNCWAAQKCTGQAVAFQ